MTYESALNAVVASTGVERYRFLCSDDNTMAPPNDKAAYRGLMLRMAKNLDNPPAFDYAAMNQSAERIKEAALAVGGSIERVNPCGSPCG